MKKIIGILSVTTLAVALFMNTNNINSTSGDINLASVIGLASANAESCEDAELYCIGVADGYALACGQEYWDGAFWDCIVSTNCE